MATLTYDNPDTMSRECWQDGELLCAYSIDLFCLKEELPIKIFFGSNIGDWKTGQFVGDFKAMEKVDEL